MAKELCEKISNTAGKCTRATVSACKGLGKATKLIIEKCVNPVKDSIIRVWAKIGNLRKRVNAESHFAYFDEKQKDTLTELGKEVFNKEAENQKEVLGQKKVRELLKKARNHENKKQKIRDEVNQQKRKMDGIVIFRRAVLDLKHDDPRVRKVAIRVLERLGNKTAVSYLTKCLEDPDPGVRERAKKSLHSLINKTKESE